MATAADIVRRAFRKLGILSKDEALQAEDMDEGLVALNMMMHAWKLNGVDLNHSDFEEETTFYLEPEFEEGTVYLLASRLSPDYEMPANFDADAFWRSVQAAFYIVPDLTFERPLYRQSPNHRGGVYDVDNG